MDHLNIQLRACEGDGILDKNEGIRVLHGGVDAQVVARADGKLTWL